eukprot:m.222735 g.222735  ORF g.222735 m.222735 type:complete len:501 (-) comp25833_c3_seq3:94-1596(-)
MSLQWTTDDDDDEILALHDDRRDSSSSLDRLESAETWQLAGWRTRGYIVLSLFLLSALQAICWNLFAPIFSTVHAVYGWEDTEVEWLANLGNIAMLISLPFTTVIVGALGPRVPTILTAAMMLACTGLRIAPQVYKDVHDVALDRRIVYSLNVMSMLLNGASAAWLSFSGPVQAEIWFPTHQRGTVTAVLSVAPYVGVSLGYIVGPLVVPEGAQGGDSLDTMLFVHTVCAASIFFAMLIYFPSEPRTAPTRSASLRAKVVESRGGVKGVALARSIVAEFMGALFGCCGRNSQAVGALWMIALAFSLPLGVQAGWGAVLAINLKKVAGIGSVTSGWIGCASTLSGCIGGIAIGALSDRFIGSLKTFVLVSYSLASVFFAAFGLLVLEYWVPSPDTVIPLIYATAIGGGFFLYCPIPLFYEMVVEETFPQIPAATSSGILSIMVTVVQICFLFAPIGRWMNWAMMLITPVGIIPLLLLSIKYPRTREDQFVHIARLDRLGIF